MTARGSHDEGLRALGDSPYSLLTTFKRDGSAVGVPVWQAVAGVHVYVFTEAKSWKVKRLRRNPHVEMTTCDWRGNPTGAPVWPGRARVVTDEAGIERAYEALDRKYGWQKWLVDLLSKLSGRYGQRAILEITLDEDAE